MRTAMKKVLKAAQAGDRDAAAASFRTAVPLIDRLAGRKLITRNRAAAYKSRLNARVRALG